jgi:hypothetical protein
VIEPVIEDIKEPDHDNIYEILVIPLFIRNTRNSLLQLTDGYLIPAIQPILSSLFIFLYLIVLYNLMLDLVNFIHYFQNQKEKKVFGYKNHKIDKNSQILMIGASGTGKSNAILNFIVKSSGESHKNI